MTASPDLSALIDLRPYDIDPWSLVADAIELQRQTLLEPSYNPLAADPEVVLLEGIAREVMEVVIAANRAPWAMLRGILNTFGVPWSPGTYATCTLRFSGTNGTVIPIGVQVQTEPGTVASVLTFTTTAAGTISGGYVDVPVTVTTMGTGAHRLDLGTKLDLVNSSTAITSVTVQTAPAGGSDAEDMTSYYARVYARMARLTDSLVLAEHFTQFALERPAIIRATTVDAWDGSSPGSVSGHITIVAGGATGTVLPQLAIDELVSSATERSVHDLTVHHISPTIVTVNVTATVRRTADFTDGEVQTAVATMLGEYLSPDTWEWGTPVLVNELIEAIGRDAPGVDTVVTLSVPTTTVTVPAIGLAKLGTATITVLAPYS